MKRKWIAALALGVVMAGSAILGGWQVPVSAAAEKTGTGLADHVMKAYQEGWKYSYGAYGQFSGSTRATDCSGLIKSYLWWTDDSHNPKAGSIAVGGGASAMLNSATEKGTIDYSDYSSLPRTHGLILYQPGHVGVYVGNDMAVDNRDYGYDIKYEPVFGRSRKKWTTWFKLPQITYPTTGFYTFQGNTYYYENGEYIIKDSRTIGDTIYTFGADGILVSEELTPEAQAAQAAQLKAEEEAAAAAEAAKSAIIPEDGAVITTFGITEEKESALSAAGPVQVAIPLAQAAPQEQEEQNNSFPTVGVIVLCGLLGAGIFGRELLQKRKNVNS